MLFCEKLARTIMKRILVILSIFLVGCQTYDKNQKIVEIKTTAGVIVVELYDQTPRHTDNFIKLTNEKFFDNIIFHRVIKNFMIQAGDPETKNPVKGKFYGETDSGYLLDAEFVDTIIHKRGVIAMARESDDNNPEKKSSGSQFYIVVGKVFTDNELDELENKITKNIIERAKKLLEETELKRHENEKNYNKLNSGNKIIEQKIDSINTNTPHFKFSAKQRQTYTTIGGTPHLDGNYTVFGEVIKGMEIVKKISETKTDTNDRPIDDIKIKMRVLN